MDDVFPEPGEHKFLLAVSAGVDSVVLADLFARCKYNFSIVHCNFQLRGEESDGDAQFAETLAEKLDVPFFQKRFDVTAYMEKEKVSVQMAARDLRYSWFRDVLKQHKFSHVVTAHHANDQAETFFIQLTRGAGMDGLSGMRVLEGQLLRPLLSFSKNELVHYATQHKLSWREDSSNAEDKYLRNRIRHELIPVMENIAPAFLETMAETMLRFQDYQDFFRAQMEEWRQRYFKKVEFGFEMEMEHIRQSPAPKLVLYELLRPFGFRGSVIAQMLDHHEVHSGLKFFSSTHRVVLSRGILLVTRITPEDLEIYEIAKGQTRVEFPVPLHLEWREGELVPDNEKTTAWLNAELLKFPLSVRSWHKGDSFFPLGMKGRKKLSDFFIDLKLSPVEKEQVKVLCSGDQIVWVIGYRIDDRYRIKSDTQRALVVTLK